MLVSQLLLPVYILTFLIGLPANILAFCTFCRKVHRKPAPIDILLLNLTISDLIFLTFLPFKMKEAIDDMIWKMPDYLCPLSSFMFFSTIYTSTLFLTGVSIERYLGVAFPIQYSVYRRPCYAVIASLFFWLVGSLNLSIVYIVPFLPSKNSSDGHSPNCSMMQPSEMKCYSNFTQEQLSILLPVRLELFVVLFCIPFIICGFCYINFIQILSRLPHISRRRRLRAIGLALGTLVVFAVCFGPYNASHVVGFVRAESEDWRELALISSTLNACLDPIIFYFSSAAVRSAISGFVKGMKEKGHVLKCGKSQCCPMLASETEKYRNTPPPDNQRHSLGQLELAVALQL
ncbi:free fatty acid receptor 2-like [Pangasianodon hypophthalmus]|uniref:free fatty acid receptor 2-like n=1 Tax=Pangasianodon hypophthalmus TaxID=310915 RepID=UPI000EFDC1D2|nr:free fatty acid receptor 2-like [Pangasianodon hypophthalmus]